jgi:hypothetical protein
MTGVRDSNAADGPSVRLLTDAVVAAYIHEISARHPRIGQPAESPVRPATAD